MAQFHHKTSFDLSDLETCELLKILGMTARQIDFAMSDVRTIQIDINRDAKQVDLQILAVTLPPVVS